MKISRPQDTDIVGRRPVMSRPSNASRLDIAAQADVAGLEPFMEAAIAAAMIIAYADGEAEMVERRRIISLFRTNPHLQGFSAEDISHEIASHAHDFELDHSSAVERACAKILAADLSRDQFRAIVRTCVSVLEADGIRHPAEEDALTTISSLRL